jgi:glycosyltransferase involved in cell wall biosynthesis
MTLARVAVIIPTYNRWPVVARAVASVLAQSHPATQCVVVDDASTDDTPRLLRQRFCEQIQLVELKSNIEKSAARNAGIRAANADYICMLDSDDELTEHSVGDRLAIFLRDRSFNGVAYGLSCPGGGGADLRWVDKQHEEGDVLLHYIRRPFVDNNGFMLSRQNALEHGMYRERLTHREDKELLIRLAARFEFRSCSAFVTRIHYLPRSARSDYRKATAQGLLMLDCLRSDPLVRARLGTHFRLVERAEHWEHLRGLYKTGNFQEYRRACAASWGLFSGCRNMQWTILRRWIGSCIPRPFTPRVT